MLCCTERPSENRRKINKTPYKKQGDQPDLTDHLVFLNYNLYALNPRAFNDILSFDLRMYSVPAIAACRVAFAAS